MINKVRAHVLGLCGDPDRVWWKSHIESVIEHSKLLAKKFNADEEVLELAAWLHDMRKMKGIYPDHHIFGAKDAEIILRENGYPEETIQKVTHCILTHSTDKNYPPQSIEAKIFSSADALSYFDHFLSFAHWVYYIEKMTIPQGREVLLKKFQGAWDKLMPEAKEIGKEKYDAILLILKTERLT